MSMHSRDTKIQNGLTDSCTDSHIDAHYNMLTQRQQTNDRRTNDGQTTGKKHCLQWIPQQQRQKYNSSVVSDRY